MDKHTLIETTKEELLAIAPDLQGIATRVTQEGDKIRLEFSTRDALYLRLRIYTLLDELTEDKKQEIRKTLELLQGAIDVLFLEKISARGFKVRYSVKEGIGSDVTARVEKAISSPPVQVAIAELLDIKPEKVSTTDPELNRAIETGTHLQPNGLLKAIAKFEGRSRTAPTLWEQGKEKRETLTRGSSDMLLQVMKAYQDLPKGEGWLVIDDLERTAKEWGLSSSQELKNVLEMLGGYVHPFIEKVPGGGLKVSYRQLLEVDMTYGKRVEEKYDTTDPKLRGNIGWLENEKVDTIILRPHQKLIDQIRGKDLGSRVVQDRLLGELPELSDLAYKTLMYAISNKQKSENIGEEKLLPKIGYEPERVYKEGISRVREKVLKALQELKDKGHLESYSYDPNRKMYSLTKSEKTAPKRKGKPRA